MYQPFVIQTIHFQQFFLFFSGVLLDTRQETQELDWPKLPVSDAWDESSVNSAGKDYRQLMVCNVAKKAEQNNWVRTKFIKNTVGAQLLYVDISFSVRSCHDLRHVKSCKESFSLHFLESNDESLEVSYKTRCQGCVIS